MVAPLEPGRLDEPGDQRRRGDVAQNLTSALLRRHFDQTHPPGRREDGQTDDECGANPTSVELEMRVMHDSQLCRAWLCANVRKFPNARELSPPALVPAFASRATIVGL